MKFIKTLEHLLPLNFIFFKLQIVVSISDFKKSNLNIFMYKFDFAL